MTCGVEDMNVFAQWKPGDHVAVTDAEMGAKQVVPRSTGRPHRA